MNRRLFLSGAATAFVATSALANLRFHGGAASAPTPPLIGPGVSWNGTAGSGGTAPVDPARVNAKPAMQWHTVGNNRVTSNFVVGLDADAVAGMSKVTFWVEGNTVDVATATLYTDTDANGNARTRLGYWITLNVSAAAAQATGTLNIYATGVANQSVGTIQNRVIGPLQILPRNTSIAKSYTVGPSTGTYATLAAARTQFLADTPESAEFVFTDTGSYNLDDYTSQYSGHTGRVVFRANGGVTATLVRGVSFVSAPSGTLGDWTYAWNWMPFSGPIEFRGSGVVLDMHNWCQLLTTSGLAPHWFNGCMITNSAGTPNTLYWNKQAHPGFLTKYGSFSYAYSYFDDVTVTYVAGSSGLTGAKLSGIKQLLGGGNHDQCGFIVNHYETQSDASFFTGLLNAIAISYSGAGTATVTVSGFVLDCRVNGTTVGGVFPITMSADGLGLQPTSNTYYQISAIASAINGIAGGAWTATASDTTRAGISVLKEGFTQTITNAGGQFLTCYLPHHTEWQHFIPGGGAFENAIFRAAIARLCAWGTSILNAEAGANDWIVKGCEFDCTTQSGNNGGLLGSHNVVTNNLYDGPLQVNTQDVYSLVAENVAPSIFAAPGSPTLPIIKDNAAVSTVTGAAGSNAGVTLANYAALQACFTNKATGDFRPAGVLPGNLKTRLNLYDGRNALRANPDAIGAWLNGGNAPSYPF